MTVTVLTSLLVPVLAHGPISARIDGQAVCFAAGQERSLGSSVQTVSAMAGHAAVTC
jgi:hypothetical protein